MIRAFFQTYMNRIILVTWVASLALVAWKVHSWTKLYYDNQNLTATVEVLDNEAKHRALRPDTRQLFDSLHAGKF